MALRQVSPVDMAWLALESRDTPMHVGGLMEFTPPADAPDDYLATQVDLMRSVGKVPVPWSLRVVSAPGIGARLPLMREDRDIDLDYHVRHSALPHPGGQRELGVLISRLHGHQLDMHRPLWEAHIIEGLDGGKRFAMYTKVHHSLIDGVSSMRLALRALSTDPEARGMVPFWGVGAGGRGKKAERAEIARRDSFLPNMLLGAARGAAEAIGGMANAGAEMARASVDSSSLQAPYQSPHSILADSITGQRRFATQRYDLERIKGIARAAGCTLNDLVLYLTSTAMRRYLAEHAKVPDRSLTAGIPVNLREDDDESTGTQVGMIVAELATNVADPIERIERIKKSTAEAKRHQRALPDAARTPYTLMLSGPYIAGLMLGLGARTPAPFSLTMSNVPGPTEPLYFNGSRLDALFPLSLLLQGNALNITCVSYAGALNFGFTGARDTLPHLQRLAIYMGESLDEIERILVGDRPAEKVEA